MLVGLALVTNYADMTCIVNLLPPSNPVAICRETRDTLSSPWAIHRDGLNSNSLLGNCLDLNWPFCCYFLLNLAHGSAQVFVSLVYHFINSARDWTFLYIGGPANGTQLVSTKEGNETAKF